MLLLLWFGVAVATLFLSSMFREQRAFLCAASFVYLFVAHALYFGSYFAYPPLYRGSFSFLSRIFHSRSSLVVWLVLYATAFSYVFYVIYFVNRRGAP
jgi:hypothetical protein